MGKTIYSEVFKKKVLKEVMPPKCRDVRVVADEVSMPYATLHGWRKREIEAILENQEQTRKFEAELNKIGRKQKDQKPLSPRVLMAIAMVEVLVLIVFILIILKVWG